MLHSIHVFPSIIHEFPSQNQYEITLYQVYEYFHYWTWDELTSQCRTSPRLNLRSEKGGSKKPLKSVNGNTSAVICVNSCLIRLKSISPSNIFDGWNERFGLAHVCMISDMYRECLRPKQLWCWFSILWNLGQHLQWGNRSNSGMIFKGIFRVSEVL